MTLHAAVWGRLGRDPTEIETATGTRMATASIAVVLDARGPHGETEAIEWVDVIAFAHLADELLRHRQGDTLTASGRLQVRLWVDREGRERRTLQIVADSLVSARTVRPASRPRGDGPQSRPVRCG